MWIIGTLARSQNWQKKTLFLPHWHNQATNDVHSYIIDIFTCIAHTYKGQTVEHAWLIKYK